MAENKNLTAEQDYAQNFMPGVHKIGRFTMAVAFILSYLPIAYFYFVKGYKAPGGLYLSGLAAIAAIGFGMWISEPETYWPILGSAGTYIAYLSGNVGGQRFPVAMAVQKNVDADINTPRGQVATIVGIVASVFANLVLLLITVIIGAWIISVLPANVIHAFGYCLVAMMGSMLLMRFTMGGKSVKDNLLGNLPYIIWGAGMYFVCNKIIPSLANWRTLFAVGGALIIAYIKYRKDKAAAEAKN